MAKKILVVDDEKMVLVSIKKLLEKEGYQVFTSESAKQALEEVKNNDFSLLICDIRMPGEDGIELIKKIRKHLKDTGKNEMPEILITGYADIARYQEAVDLGIKDYIHKPFDNKDLILAVKSFLA